MVDPVTGTTLATATASVQRPSAILTANPNPIINDGTGLGTTTIIVNANTPVNVYANGNSALWPYQLRNLSHRQVGNEQHRLYRRRCREPTRYWRR